jgi:pimeloyl-ACP methyl ester carboxylesterase
MGDRLAEITVPTLVVAGEFDVILPPRFGQAVAAAIPNARFPRGGRLRTSVLRT